MALSPDTNISPTAFLTYWKSIPSTIDGMLGGYPQISRADLKGSSNFLSKLQRLFPPSSPSPLHRGVDCGAGIGRVTSGFLSTVCETVDIVEPVEKFANQARDAKVIGPGQVGNVYVTCLQDWMPEERQYDLIWIQWCLGHLKDKEVVSFLVRCKKAVEREGWIVIKENMSTERGGGDVFDETDSSVTRTDGKFQKLFKEADVRCLKADLQRGFPKELYPVRFYALRP